MSRTTGRLSPQHMSNHQLYQRARTLVDALRWRHGRQWKERERLLDELDEVLVELQMRGTQLTLV